MKQEEQSAQIYLRSLGLGEPTYEPKGNVPPDFVLNEQVAVEVRRLNESFFGDVQNDPLFTKTGATASGRSAAPYGLESHAISSERAIRQVLASYDARFQGSTFYVMWEFGRPGPTSKKELAAALEPELSRVAAGGRPHTSWMKVTDSLAIRIYVSPVLRPGRLFIPGMTRDVDSGGWTSEIYVKNVTHCLREKELKVRSHLGAFPVWWLVLVDHIRFGLETEEKAALESAIGKSQIFSKLLIIDRTGGSALLQLDLA